MEIKSIIKLTKSFWNKTGQLAAQWIRADAEKGKFQTPTGKSIKDFYNKAYAKYKANRMERFTTTKNGKKGQKINAYYGRSTTGTQTSKVDMRVTGDLLDSLKVKDSNNTSVKVGFEGTKDNIGKLRGALEYQRLLVGLNDDNINKVKGLIISEFEKNKKALPKVINIKIKI